MSARQKIKLKLKAFDHRVLDLSVKEIVHTVKRTGATIQGPIPMPRKIERFSVNRSPHIDKESSEAFEIRNHVRLMIIDTTTSPQTIDALKKLELPAGIEVEIKLMGNE